jgi:hypothetical protein
VLLSILGVLGVSAVFLDEPEIKPQRAQWYAEKTLDSRFL